MDDDIEFRLALKASYDWLDKMREHTDCCGVPQMKRLLAALKQNRLPQPETSK
jgi:hypothetical protein